jgi:hypothetical protein
MIPSRYLIPCVASSWWAQGSPQLSAHRLKDEGFRYFSKKLP